MRPCKFDYISKHISKERRRCLNCNWRKLSNEYQEKQLSSLVLSLHREPAHSFLILSLKFRSESLLNETGNQSGSLYRSSSVNRKIFRLIFSLLANRRVNRWQQCQINSSQQKVCHLLKWAYVLDLDMKKSTQKSPVIWQWHISRGEWRAILNNDRIWFCDWKPS